MSRVKRLPQEVNMLITSQNSNWYYIKLRAPVTMYIFAAVAPLLMLKFCSAVNEKEEFRYANEEMDCPPSSVTCSRKRWRRQGKFAGIIEATGNGDILNHAPICLGSDQLIIVSAMFIAHGNFHSTWLPSIWQRFSLSFTDKHCCSVLWVYVRILSKLP